jgi:2-polyprenyl-3-methyl-5-hydroxy-6-metoxy-1,4-benzoquinol methylase
MTPYLNVNVDYGLAQLRHPDYAQLAADNEWIRSILERGPERYWAEMAITYLCTRRDSRYVAALTHAARAARAGRSISVLEVGCNLGYIGAIMLRLGHRYVGIDVQEHAIAKAREYYGPSFLCEPVEVYASRSRVLADEVWAFEVLEHVQHPRTFIDDCMRTLRSGGDLLVTTPDGDQCPPDEWIGEFPPYHRNLFTRKALRLLAEDGWRVEFVADRQPVYTGHYERTRLLRRIGRIVGTRRMEGVPQVGPGAPDFAYDPERMTNSWDMPRGPNRVGALLRLTATIVALMTGDTPVGSTLIAQVTKPY